jgi:hypothetical protein
MFIASLLRKIGPITAAQHLLHADIGLTGPWGIPFPAGKPSLQRLNKWKAYPKTPWAVINHQNNHPDLVLIDGRFRVATALTCCIHMRGCSTAQIVVDDYADRPSYHVIEKHAKLVRMLDRMVVFEPSHGDQSKLNEVIHQYPSDWL